MKDVWILFVEYGSCGEIMWDMWDHEPIGRELNDSLLAAVNYHGVDAARSVRVNMRVVDASYPKEMLSTLFEAFTKAYAGGIGPKK